MGGNVQIKNINADTIDLNEIDRQKLIKSLMRFFTVIDRGNKGKFKTSLFGNQIFFSGSSTHLFDKNISDDEFKKYKPLVGDIDVQIDYRKEMELLSFLEETSGFLEFRFIGYKKSVNQYITLWYIGILDINVQIDFELVEFENGAPTEWSQFAHSSAWDDIKIGVKGVAHKYLWRAVTARSLKDVIIRMKTKDKKVKSTEWAFSPSGFRKKLEFIENQNGVPVYRELSTEDTGFNKNLDDLYRTLIHDSTPKFKKDMSSFIGTLSLINEHFTPYEKKIVASGFTETLWGYGAQKLYRDDDKRDRKEKEIMTNVLYETLGLEKIKHDEMMNAYYK